jgi:predicted DNA-binding transcriptional regulator YafY
MNQTERFYKIDALLTDRRLVRFTDLEQVLEVSPATIKRDLAYMRDRMNAPIIYDRERGGYRYETPSSDGPAFKLPGTWFNASEIHALLTMQALLSAVQPGLLGPHIAPLQARLQSMIGSQDDAPAEVAKRIRIVHAIKRFADLKYFDVIASATLKRRRVVIRHWIRSRDETIEREVSPQRLVYYRDTWYLDAFCHLRGEVRSFGVDAIRSVSLLDAVATDIAAQELDNLFAAGYGIFSGSDIQWAKLRFTPESARWVSGEQWHPLQRNTFDVDGYYVLEVPYAHPTELIMDILRHADAVEVLSPPDLRTQVAARLRAAINVYDGDDDAQPAINRVPSGACMSRSPLLAS